MVVYAVIDTNVLVSAILAVHPNSATVIIREKIMDGTIVPLYNGEIVDEYQDVLSRPKFHFPIDLVTSLFECNSSERHLFGKDKDRRNLYRF